MPDASSSHAAPTRAELLGVVPVCLLAATVVVAWGVDLAGFQIRVGGVLPLSLALAVAACAGLWRSAGPDRMGSIGWAAVVTVVAAWLGWMAWPAWLPLGGGSDLVHHLGLIRYIETSHRLVHDTAAERWLGEMVVYTPGSHLLVVLGANLFGTDGLQMVHPVMSVAVALKAGLVALIVMRLTPVGGWQRAVVGAGGVCLMMLPRAYVVGSFAHDSYVAQVVSETFAVAMLWALVAWDERPSLPALAVFALCGAAAFLTWPIWVGPPLLAAGLLVVARSGLRARSRVASLLLAAGPVAVVAAVYLVGRLAWTGIVKTGGVVVPPSLSVFGAIFAAAAALGLMLTVGRRQMRAVVTVLAVIVLQAAALYAVAAASGAQTPYLSFKMFYLAVYPLAAVGAVGAAVAADWMSRRMTGVAGSAFASLAGATAIVIAVALVGGSAVRGALKAPAPRPVVTVSMQQAARWLRAAGTVTCVDYITRDWVSAYWLHTVELGNPRVTRRTQDITDRFEPRAVVGRWVDPRGDFQFAIVEDLEQVHPDARLSMDVLQRFGPAAVVRRREPVVCPPDAPPLKPRP